MKTDEGRAETGSVPNDPIAVEATIGTGGLPSQHGITGALILLAAVTTAISGFSRLAYSLGEHGQLPRAYGRGTGSLEALR